MLVITDTPLRYLILLGYGDILSVLFGCIVIPRTAVTELQPSKTPPVVLVWMAQPPAWVKVRQGGKSPLPPWCDAAWSGSWPSSFCPASKIKNYAFKSSAYKNNSLPLSKIRSTCEGIFRTSELIDLCATG